MRDARIYVPNVQLREHRLRHNLTLEEVAEALIALAWERFAVHVGVNAGMVGKWERAYRDGGVEALVPRPKEQFNPMATPAPKPDSPPGDDERTREQLLDEILQLRMELAYTKKLQALVQARQQQVPQKKRK